MRNEFTGRDTHAEPAAGVGVDVQSGRVAEEEEEDLSAEHLSGSSDCSSKIVDVGGAADAQDMCKHIDDRVVANVPAKRGSCAAHANRAGEGAERSRTSPKMGSNLPSLSKSHHSS